MKQLLMLLTVLGACATEPAIDRATCGEARTYRIDAIELARNNAAARELALDLDQDDFVDNQLGQVTATLMSMFQSVPLDLEASAAGHFAADTDWRISIAECDGVGRIAALSSGADAPTLDLEGAGSDDVLTVRGPGGAVPLTALFDGTGTAVPVFMTAEVAQLELEVGDDELSGKLGVALDSDDQAFLVVRAMTPFLDRHLDVGFDEIDNNGDGTLTEEEVATNALVQALLEPDLVIGGVDAMSLGMRVHATRVR